MFLYAAVGAATATGVAFLVADKYSASDDDGVVVPPKHPWGHAGFFTSFDHMSLVFLFFFNFNCKILIFLKKII